MGGDTGNDDDGEVAKAEILKFFTEKHSEGQKEVPAEELIALQGTTLGQGQFSKIRLIEVSKLKQRMEKDGYFYKDGERNPDAETLPEYNGFFAQKMMKKTEIVRLKQVEHVRNESLIHNSVHHPFLTTLFHRYQDERNLYLVLEFVQGGTLFNMIQRNGRLPNDTARFFAAQVVMAVQYLHSEHILYRDLNPDNVLLDRGKYVKLSDFGLSKPMNFDDPTQRTWTLCGQPEYLAPEIIQSKGHSKEVDWWALGILNHHMLAGYPPWYHKDSFKIYQMVLQTRITEEFFPKHFDKHGADLIKKLLTKDRAFRIGSSKNGAEDIKKHKWYRGLNWAALYNKQLEMPISADVTWTPMVETALDTNTQNTYVTSTEETGPALDPEKDLQFVSWELISKETDFREGKKRSSPSSPSV